MRNSLSRQFAIFAALIVFVVAGSASYADDQSTDISIVDTHVHFWDLQRPEGIYWIAPEDKVLYQSFLPQVYEPIAKANHVRGVVVVQAGQSLPDNQWNLDITSHNPLPRGRRESVRSNWHG